MEGCAINYLFCLAVALKKRVYTLPPLPGSWPHWFHMQMLKFLTSFLISGTFKVVCLFTVASYLLRNFYLQLWQHPNHTKVRRGNAEPLKSRNDLSGDNVTTN